MPLIWNHPGKIPSGRAVPSMVSSYDFFPTILEYLGAPVPRAGRRPGKSYTRLLREDAPDWRNRLYLEYGYVRGLRSRNLKYIERTREWPSELYDLEADPGESKNVIADKAYGEVVAKLRAELGDFFRRSGAPPIEEWRRTVRQRHLDTHQRVTP